MPTLQDLQAQDAAYAKAGNDAQTAEQAKQTFGSTGQPNGILSWMTQMPKRITSDMIDSAVHAADSMAHDGSWGEAATRVGRDVAAGAADAVANTGDAVEGLARTGVRATYESIVHPQQAALEAEDPAMQARDRMMDGSSQTSPIWQHARSAILDFRDAVAVKDPNLVDGLTQSVAQLAIPFAGYSKALSGVHDAAIVAQGLEDIPATQGFGSYLAKTAQKDLTGFATKVAAPGAVTDATALKPHAMRFADLIALGRHTEGKLGDVLQALAPDGSAQDAYIRYLTDRGDESEAEGRFKNVLDGFGVNLLATPLIAAVGSVLKQGTAGLRYLADNGVASGADFPRPPRATQTGSVLGRDTASPDKVVNPEQPVSAMGVLHRSDGTVINEPPLGVAPVREQLRRAAAADREVPYQEVARNLAQSLAGQNSPYRAVLRQLGEGMDPDLRIVSHENTGHATMGPNVYGSYNPTTHTVAIHPEGFSADDETLLHTIAHEGVHAATIRALRDPENLSLRRAMTRLAVEVDSSAAAQGLRGQARYGLLRDEQGRINPEEFVAEAAANPALKKAMTQTAAPEGGSLWDEYSGLLKMLTRGALGAGAAATWMNDKKLFDNVISPRVKEPSGA